MASRRSKVETIAARRTRGLRVAVKKALEKAFPDDVVQMIGCPEESYLAPRYLSMKAGFLRIKGAGLLYERDAYGEFGKKAGSAGEHTLPCGGGFHAYHTFFLGLTGRKYRYEVEERLPDEKGVLRQERGVETIGCTVGISLVAPVAVVMADCIQHFDEGTHSLPDGHPGRFDVGGNEIDALDPAFYWGEVIGKEGIRAVQALSRECVSLLEAHGFTVLTQEEARRPVRGLRAGEDVYFGGCSSRKPVVVRDAFFFQGP